MLRLWTGQVWEVTAQMIGLALSVGALRSIESAHLPGALPARHIYCRAPSAAMHMGCSQEVHPSQTGLCA